jgi:membrane associated rhomboid family serine protease
LFLPIGDTPNPQGWRPWVTWLLILANVAVYVLWTLPLTILPADPGDPTTAEIVRRIVDALPRDVDPRAVLQSLSAWDLEVHRWGYRPGAPSVATLFSAMFMHAGFAHLAGNMLFLWIYGDNVEHRLGRLPFLAAYLATGAVATLSFALVAPDPQMPLVGASGAISGVLGLYFLQFPRNLVKVLVVLFPFFFNVWLVRAPIVLGLYVLVDNLLPFVVGAGGGVAYGAHLGGFVGGMAIAWAVGRRDAQVEPDEDPALAHLAKGEALLRQDKPSAAFQHLLRALELARDDGTRARVRRALAELPLDPRLRAQLGL